MAEMRAPGGGVGGGGGGRLMFFNPILLGKSSELCMLHMFF